MKLFILTTEHKDTWTATAVGVKGVVAQGTTEQLARMECQKMLKLHFEAFGTEPFKEALETLEVGLCEFTFSTSGGQASRIMTPKRG